MTLKDVSATLALNEHLKNLGKMSEHLSHEPGLLPHEQEHLKLTRVLTLSVSLRSEHPALGRLADYLMSKPGAGDAPPKISEAEWTTLKTLIGPDISRTERDFLDHLRRTDRFEPNFRTQQVEPYRKQMTDARVAVAAAAGGWGARKGQVAGVTAVQLGFLAGGFFISPLLFIANVAFMILGQGKVNSAIAKQYNEKVGGHGVNALAGDEVQDESRIGLENVAGTDVFHASTVEDVVAMATEQRDLLSTLRTIRPPLDNGPGTQIAKALDHYENKLGALLEQHAAQPMDLAALKDELMSIMADAITPDIVWAATTGAINDAFGPVAGSASGNFAEVQKLLFETAEQALIPGEIEGPEDEVVLRDTAEMYLKASRLQQRLGDDETVIDKTLSEYFQVALDDPAGAAASPEGQKLAKKLEKVRDHVEDVHKKGTRTFVSKKQARNIGDQVVSDLFKHILPRYVPGTKDIVSASGGKATQKGESFEYTASLRGSMFGATGQVTITIEKDGTVQADSLKLDVGRSQAERIVAGAIEHYDVRATAGKAKTSADGYAVPIRTTNGAFDVAVAKHGAPSLADIAKAFTA